MSTICAFILICSIGTNATYGAIPFGYRFNWQSYRVSDHARVGHNLLSLIPDDPNIAVCATLELMPYLSHRISIYPFPYPFIKSPLYSNKHKPLQPTYVMIDTSDVAVNRMHLDHREGFLRTARMVIQHPEYQVFDSQDGFVLLRRNHEVSE